MEASSEQAHSEISRRFDDGNELPFAEGMGAMERIHHH